MGDGPPHLHTFRCRTHGGEIHMSREIGFAWCFKNAAGFVVLHSLKRVADRGDAVAVVDQQRRTAVTVNARRDVADKIGDSR